MNNDKRAPKLTKYAPIRVVYGTFAAIITKLPRIAFFVLAFYAIFWVGQQLYFKYAPANQFLDFYYAKVDDTPVGTEPLMTLCRRVNYDGIKIEAYRTFIQFQGEDNKRVTVGEYNFDANVESDDGNCTNVRLKKQPQVAGTYEAYTEYVFEVNGNRKSGSYTTNQYNMTEVVLSTNEQITALQLQIDELNRQLDALKAQGSASQNSSAAGTSGNTQSVQPQTVTPAPQQNTGNGNNNGNAGNNGGTTTPPPPSRPSCTINLGIGLLCGNDGLLRL